MSILDAFLFWVGIGNVIIFLQYYVYFRGFEHALDHYKMEDHFDQEDKNDLENLKGHPHLYPIGLMIAGSLFGPFAIVGLIRDIYNFSIKKKK